MIMTCTGISEASELPDGATINYIVLYYIKGFR